ncbi:MAG TPA: hypothetical protein VM599_02700 [Thermoanaerobaculia bacterium]|nr:hypothetical protein [Thermoanaerobaculia bacterium]
MNRTFPAHQHRSPLHGITVVVETAGGETWIGRCDDEDAERVILLDADVHAAGDADSGRDAWLAKAARFGPWARHARVVLPRRAVHSLYRLGEVEAG